MVELSPDVPKLLIYIKHEHFSCCAPKKYVVLH